MIGKSKGSFLQSRLQLDAAKEVTIEPGRKRGRLHLIPEDKHQEDQRLIGWTCVE
jgi:hypothetical protein